MSKPVRAWAGFSDDKIGTERVDHYPWRIDVRKVEIREVAEREQEG